MFRTTLSAFLIAAALLQPRAAGAETAYGHEASGAALLTEASWRAQNRLLAAGVVRFGSAALGALAFAMMVENWDRDEPCESRECAWREAFVNNFSIPAAALGVMGNAIGQVWFPVAAVRAARLPKEASSRMHRRVVRESVGGAVILVGSIASGAAAAVKTSDANWLSKYTLGPLISGSMLGAFLLGHARALHNRINPAWNPALATRRQLAYGGAALASSALLFGMVARTDDEIERTHCNGDGGCWVRTEQRAPLGGELLILSGSMLAASGVIAIGFGATADRRTLRILSADGQPLAADRASALQPTSLRALRSVRPVERLRRSHLAYAYSAIGAGTAIAASSAAYKQEVRVSNCFYSRLLEEDVCQPYLAPKSRKKARALGGVGGGLIATGLPSLVIGHKAGRVLRGKRAAAIQAAPLVAALPGGATFGVRVRF